MNATLDVDPSSSQTTTVTARTRGRLASLSPLARALLSLGLGAVLAGPFLALVVVSAIAATGCFMSCSDPNLPAALVAAWAAAAMLVGWARSLSWGFGIGEGVWSRRGALVAIATMGTLWVAMVRIA